MAPENYVNILNEKFGVGTATLSSFKSIPPAIRIDKDKIYPVCQELFSNDQAFFDLLECITGIDNGPSTGTLEIIYHLYSIPLGQKLALQILLQRNTENEPLPEIDSVSTIWRTAEWLERETYDLVGIHFRNHPDLRRILLPHDWVGHPLRKDHNNQEYYHGIKVAY